MFKGANLFSIIQAGGFTIYILLLCSVCSITIIVERLIYYRKRSRIRRVDLMDQIRKAISLSHIHKAQDLCRETDTPFSKVALSGLMLAGHNEKTISEAMDREVVIETIKLERFTSVIGTIGSTAVYIGLFGTVIGIIRAFKDISLSGSGGVNVVIGGISEALVCTAAGLLVAIPAVITYNFIIRKIDNFTADMELCASELIDLLCARQK